MAKRARGVYKRGKIWWVMFADTSGTMHYESSKSHVYDDAVTLLHNRKHEVKDVSLSNGSGASHTLKELIERYTVWMQGRHRSAESKEYRLNRMLATFGDIPLSRLDNVFVEQYQQSLMSAEKKPATVNKNVNILKAVIKKAVEWNMLDESVLKKLRMVKSLPENNARLRYLSKEECHALINACDSHLKPIVITALNTGLRRANILNLRWEEVDLVHGFIHLNRTKNGERHDIPINKTLRAVLEVLPRRAGVPFLFADTSTGKPYFSVKRSFKAACKKAGITDFRFHDMRATFASHLIMAGADLVTVKDLMCHKTLAMTLRYAHLSPNHKVKAIGLLEFL